MLHLRTYIFGVLISKTMKIRRPRNRIDFVFSAEFKIRERKIPTCFNIININLRIWRAMLLKNVVENVFLIHTALPSFYYNDSTFACCKLLVSYNNWSQLILSRIQVYKDLIMLFLFLIYF